jgi:uncharacterized protein with ParB-like and HNH nuclease domain
MDTSASNRRLRVLLTGISNQSLIPQPDFQRRLVWTNKDKVEFIRTVLEGFPFPEIYIAAGKVDPKTGEGSEVLVDGQQRITTLFQYFKDSNPDLKLPKDIKKYQDLEEDLQINFLEYKVVVRDLGNMPLEEIKKVFRRINSTSYSLNAMEIHNARYDGEFKKFAESISALDFFNENRVFTSTDIKRMNDVRYCSGLIATIMSTYFTRDQDLEEYLSRYNEDFPLKDILERSCNQVFNFISRMNFSKDSRAFKKADFFTLFVELYCALITDELSLDVSKVRQNLDTFYEKVEMAAQQSTTQDVDALTYYKAALQASNDRVSRISRGKIIAKTLRI